MKRVLAVSLLGCLLAAVIWHRGARRVDTDPARKASVDDPVTIVKAGADSAVAPAPVVTPAERSVQLCKEIADGLRRDGARGQNRVANDLLPALVAIDAAAAGRLAETWDSGEQRRWLLREVSHLWSTADCAGAIKWVSQIADSGDRQTAGETVVAQIAQLDPAGALTAAQLFQVGLEDGSQEHIAQIWAEASPVEAVDWISKRPPSEQRDRLVARIARVRGERNPAEAATLALNLLPAGPVLVDTITSVARQWGERDPNAATLWAQQLPSAELRAGCLGAIASARKNR